MTKNNISLTFSKSSSGKGVLDTNKKMKKVKKFKDNFFSIIERRDLSISLVGYQEDF